MADNIFEYTDANFATDVEGSEGIVVVDFWAPWCGPCRLVAPIVEQLAAEYAGRVRFGKVNVDENPRVSARYGIRSIPTIAVFRNGEPVDSAVGALPKPMLARLVEKHLPAAA